MALVLLFLTAIFTGFNSAELALIDYPIWPRIAESTPPFQESGVALDGFKAMLACRVGHFRSYYRL